MTDALTADVLALDPDSAGPHASPQSHISPVPQPSDGTKRQDLGQRLEQVRFRAGASFVRPVALLKLRDLQIATAGNIVNLQGPPKSAKSSALGGMMAAVLHALMGKAWPAKDVDVPATLNFRSDLAKNSDGLILHFDTEQSHYDHHQNILRLLKRSGTAAVDAEPHLRSFSLVNFDLHERWEAITRSLNAAHADGKTVVAIFIDGVADILSDPNNSEESFARVAQLHSLANRHQLTVFTVLHENPDTKGGGSGKTRGHLGSQIERKAETNLRVSWDERKQAMVIWAERTRQASIPIDQGTAIVWCGTRKHHVLKSDAIGRPTAEVPTATDAVTEPPRPTPEQRFITAHLANPVQHKELLAKVETQFKVKKRTANTRINEWVKKGWIFKGPGKQSPYQNQPFEDSAADEIQIPGKSVEPNTEQVVTEQGEASPPKKRSKSKPA